jgi:hypothetical protein
MTGCFVGEVRVLLSCLGRRFNWTSLWLRVAIAQHCGGTGVALDNVVALMCCAVYLGMWFLRNSRRVMFGEVGEDLERPVLIRKLPGLRCMAELKEYRGCWNTIWTAATSWVSETTVALGLSSRGWIPYAGEVLSGLFCTRWDFWIADFATPYFTALFSLACLSTLTRERM